MYISKLDYRCKRYKNRQQNNENNFKQIIGVKSQELKIRESNLQWLASRRAARCFPRWGSLWPWRKAPWPQLPWWSRTFWAARFADPSCWTRPLLRPTNSIAEIVRSLKVRLFFCTPAIVTLRLRYRSRRRPAPRRAFGGVFEDPVFEVRSPSRRVRATPDFFRSVTFSTMCFGFATGCFEVGTDTWVRTLARGWRHWVCLSTTTSTKNT